MKAIEIQSPNKIVVPEGYSSMFLAGSIEMGIAEDWQKRVQKQLLDKEIVFLNPRRDDWDASWEQTIENPKFKEHSSKMMVCCPEGFWRKGNVDIICERYGITQFDSLNEIYL